MTWAGRTITGVTGPTKQVPLIGLLDTPTGDQDFINAAMELLVTVAQHRPGLFVPPALLPAPSSASRSQDGALLGEVAQWMSADHGSAVVVPVSFRPRLDTETTVRQVITDAAHKSGVRLIQARSICLEDPVLGMLDTLCRQAKVAPDHLVVLLAMWSTDPSWDQAVHDLAETWSTQRPGSVRVEFTGLGRPNRKALHAYRETGDPFGVIPVVLPSPREHLWTFLGKRKPGRFTASIGQALPELILARYDEAMHAGSTSLN